MDDKERMALPGKAVAAEAVSLKPDAMAAVEEVLAKLQEAIGGAPDLVVVFATPHHRAALSDVIQLVHGRLQPDALIGSTLSGVISGGREHQVGPALSIWAARLPGTRVQAFRLDLDVDNSRILGWPDVGESASIALFADPFSFPLEPFFDSLRRLDELPVVIGGLASGADRAGENMLFSDGELHQSGAVGFVMDGAFRLEPVVAQGCRPIGPSFTVTRAEGNVVYELGGKSAYTELSEMLVVADDEARQLFMRAPQIGIQPAPLPHGEAGGDLLTRAVMGVDPDEGAIAVTDELGEGDSIQFQARDRDHARAELQSLAELAGSYCPKAVGGLLFTCTGRGLPFFQRADHDIEVVHDVWPELPVGGGFVAGEIGPVCGKPYIHGLSAVFGLLVPREA